MFELTPRVNNISPSGTLEVTMEAQRLRDLGKDVIALSAGEPDFTTPQHIIDAGKKALDDGFTHYPPVPGFPKLRKAIADKLHIENNIEYTPENILVTVGAKQAIFLAMNSVLCQDFDVMIPVPYWVSYPEIAKIADSQVNYVPTYEDNNFAPTLEDLEKAVTPKTHAIIYSSPSNPAGTVYTEEQLRVIAEFALEHKLWIIADEIYEKLVFEGEHKSILNAVPEAKDITILINGFSKAYAMTGWRIGYLAAKAELVNAAKKMQGHMNTGVSSFVQMAAIEALHGDQEPLQQMKTAFHQRRDLMYKLLIELPGITCRKPEGAFYCFANISEWIGKTIRGTKINDSNDFCLVCLKEALVAIVPGQAFGQDKFVRFSFATSEKNIEESMRRLNDLFSNS